MEILDKLFSNPFVLMFLALTTGLAIGRMKIFGIKIGISGTLFTGIFFGYFAFVNYAFEMGSEYFNWNLIFFVAAVGLLAARDIGAIMKRYGLKFIILGIVITLMGAIGTYAMVMANPGQDPFLVSGVYTGALTSSPGLGAAIETCAAYGKAAQANVGIGHAIGYPFGVLIVIFGVQLIPKIFRINLAQEKQHLQVEMMENAAETEGKEDKFDILAFGAVLFIGYLAGLISIPLPKLGDFSLGSTGGVLLCALFLGYKGKLGVLNFRMNQQVLEAIQKLSLAFFLAIVGIQCGPGVVQVLQGGGAYLVLTALVSGIVAIMSGFFLGRYVFKINWILLAGALCGGMTSTPGLGAAIDATGDNTCAAGYGATYPMALFCMVLFTILLHHVCPVY